MSRIERFVFDTNALISSLLLKQSIAFKALEKAQNIGYIVFSNETFHEFENVLMRKKFDRYFSNEERLIVIGKMYNESLIVSVKSEIYACRDVKDDKFLNLAIDSAASCIITGDNDLLVLNPFQNIPIISPGFFLTDW